MATHSPACQQLLNPYPTDLDLYSRALCDYPEGTVERTFIQKLGRMPFRSRLRWLDRVIAAEPENARRHEIAWDMRALITGVSA